MTEEEAHKPVRKRRQASDGGGQQEAPLQLVETQIETPPIVADDEEPRRPVRRRRRGGDAGDSEPLKLVETQHATDEQRPDAQP